MTQKKERPDTLKGETIRVKSDCGTLYLTLNKNENGELIEIRPVLGKSGNCVRTLLECIGILYSVLLQTGIPKEEVQDIIKKHLLGVSCNNPFVHNDKKFRSCIDWAAYYTLQELGDSSVAEKLASKGNQECLIKEVKNL